jgi:peptidoglycan/xylan/chitin deacetylase (PgdA/CDA1 family)
MSIAEYGAARNHGLAVPILMYHSVDDTGPPELARHRVSRSLFEDQLGYMRRHGYYSIGLNTLLSRIVAGSSFPGRPVILTFDDGYQDFLANAWPALRRADFTATLFIVTHKVGQAADWNEASGSSLDLLDWDELRYLNARGVEIASHGALHKDLSTLSPADALWECAESRRVLSQSIGVDTTAIAFPWGRSTADVRNVARSCGYKMGLRSDGGPCRATDDLLGLPRVEVFGTDDGKGLVQKLFASVGS